MDTPGFNNTDRSDLDILLQIQAWLKNSFDGEQCLSAILYLHPITGTRFQGSGRLMMSRFKKLLGREGYKNVLLVSTFWNQVPRQTCLMREKELMEMPEAWKPLIDEGARVERMGRDYHRFVAILGELAQLSPVKLDVQQGIGSDGRAIEHATVALLLLDLRAEHDAKLARVKENLTKELEEQASRAPVTKEVMETGFRENYEKELAQQSRENAAILAKLREIADKHEKERRACQRLLEESSQKDKELREKREAEAQKTMWKEKKSKLEAAGDLLLRASAVQAERLEDAMDLIRAIHHSDLPLTSIFGISLNGIGIFAEGIRGGKNLQEYSVTRSGLNTWCDACRYPIGAKIRYREYCWTLVPPSSS